MAGKNQLKREANKRDNYKCIDCGVDGTHTHHIIPNLETLDNLVTLCAKCHKKRHSMSGCFKTGNEIGYETRFKQGVVNLLNKTHFWHCTRKEWVSLEEANKGRKVCDRDYMREYMRKKNAATPKDILREQWRKQAKKNYYNHLEEKRAYGREKYRRRKEQAVISTDPA